MSLECKIKYLMNIKRKYECSITEKTNSKVLIKDLANFFKIPIDKERIEDYQINTINFDDISIEITDSQTNTTFIANYSKESEVLGFIAYEEIIKFINIVSKSSFFERKWVYYIGEEKPILERLIIYNEEYGLLFKKTMPKVINGIYKQDGIQLFVSYFKKDEHKHECELLRTLYKTNYTYKNINSFEREYVADSIMTYDKNRPDHFCYDVNGDIIVGTKLRSNNYFIDGACFEKIDGNMITEVFAGAPGESQIKNYSEFDTSLTESAILYAGYSYLGKVLYYDLEIKKTNESISIKYSIKDRSNIFPNPIVFLETNCVIPNIQKNNITIAEVDNIILELQNEFEDGFIQFVINELMTFKWKLSMKNGLVQEILNPLSPKILINKPFEEIYDFVSTNKEEYFKLIREQFESATNIAQIKENGQSRILKPSTSQE